MIIWRLSALDLVARNIWTARGFYPGEISLAAILPTRGKCRCKRIALGLKAGESLAA